MKLTAILSPTFSVKPSPIIFQLLYSKHMFTDLNFSKIKFYLPINTRSTQQTPKLFLTSYFSLLKNTQKKFLFIFFQVEFSPSPSKFTLIWFHFTFHFSHFSHWRIYKIKNLHRDIEDCCEFFLMSSVNCLSSTRRKTLKKLHKSNFVFALQLCTASDSALTSNEAEWREINFHVKSRRAVKLN